MYINFKLYFMMKNFQFIDFLSTSLVVELLCLFLFRLTTMTGKSINQWYTNLKWTAVLLDVLSLLIGFYLAFILLTYLTINKGVTFSLYSFLFLVLAIQIIHDFGFYFFFIKNATRGTNAIMDEFSHYAKNVGAFAAFSDSLLYIIATPILFALYSCNQDIKLLISVACLYLIGFFIYQKPKPILNLGNIYYLFFRRGRS